MCMEIMFIDQQALLTTIDKDIQFCGLVTLSNIPKEDRYWDLDIVMRHCNKVGFPLNALNVTASLNSLWMKRAMIWEYN